MIERAWAFAPPEAYADAMVDPLYDLATRADAFPLPLSPAIIRHIRYLRRTRCRMKGYEREHESARRATQ
jgi:hypothetical protein